MQETNLLEAFASHRAKPMRQGRSATRPDGALVVSCWYPGFKRIDSDVLRYEEDLSGGTGEVAARLRAHLAEAKTNECEVHVIVAVRTTGAAGSVPRGKYYARKDLVGRLTAFDGERFVIDFRRSAVEPPIKREKGRLRSS